MDVALTFGSLGDIIAVCQIAIQLGKALGVACAGASGSAKEYQDLRKDLDMFVQILMHVVAAYQQHEFTPGLTSLVQTTKNVVEECMVLIKDALDRLVPRYNNSLQPEGSGNRIKDGCKKVEWLLRDKDRLLRLQDRLQTNTGRLSAMILLVEQHSARADNATVVARIEEVRKVLGERQQVQQTLLSYIRDHERTENYQSRLLRRVDRRVNEQKESSETLLDAVKRTLTAIVHVRDMLCDVAEKVVYLQVMVSNFIYIRPLDPTKDQPVTLEDALGFCLTLPLDWVEDWEDMYGLLEVRFKRRKGYDLVMKRKFAFEENCSGQDLDQRLPIVANLRRGMKINMSMVFINPEIIQGSCPRCKMVSDVPDGVTTTCLNEYCGMSFRVLRLNEDDHTEGTESDVMEPFESVIGGSEREIETNSRDIQTEASSVPVRPSDFQRVRLLSITPLSPTPAQLNINIEVDESLQSFVQSSEYLRAYGNAEGSAASDTGNAATPIIKEVAMPEGLDPREHQVVASEY